MNSELSPAARSIPEATIDHLTLREMCAELWYAMSANSRYRLLLALLCAIFYSVGTAALPMLIQLPQQDYHDVGFIHIGHFPLILCLTALFLLRPIALRGHVRNISKALKPQVALKRGYGISLAHLVLLGLTKDVPLLVVLGLALAVNLGLWTVLAIVVVGGGLYLANLVIRRHRKKAQRKVYEPGDRYLADRNARADTEALSDLPQSILIAGTVLWFGYLNEPFNSGLIASLIVNIILASPPIRRLTKLYARVALQQRNDKDDDDE